MPKPPGHPSRRRLVQLVQPVPDAADVRRRPADLLELLRSRPDRHRRRTPRTATASAAAPPRRHGPGPSPPTAPPASPTPTRRSPPPTAQACRHVRHRPVVAEQQPRRVERGELADRRERDLEVEVRRRRRRPQVAGLRDVDARRVADVQVAARASRAAPRGAWRARASSSSPGGARRPGPPRPRRPACAAGRRAPAPARRTARRARRRTPSARSPSAATGRRGAVRPSRAPRPRPTGTSTRCRRPRPRGRGECA